jgi:hypothetical protein
MWVNIANINNYRILEIASGSPPTTGSSDGASTPGLFFGLNSGGGLQTYVNNVNGNSVGTSIAAGTTSWNNGGTLGSLTANTWYFVALTYDSVNGSVLYSGDQTDAAVAAATLANGAGALNLSSATSLTLLDRFSGGRGLPGQIDDVSLYSGDLTLSQIDAIQASEVTIPVPEPSTLAMIGLGGILSFIVARRRQN